MKNKITESVNYLQQQGVPKIKLGMVLGTGLHDMISHIKVEKQISYQKIPHFPLPTQKFQKGQILYGILKGKPILVFQGRFHLYEGYDFFEITYLVRVFAALGGTQLILSNAAGAINLHFRKGELMLIKDHINLQGGSPLALKNMESLGERFIDMSAPYDPTLRSRTLELAKKEKICLHQGVYASVVGPQLETPAEYRYLKIIGADAVGMSTVPEVIVARQLNIEVLAISVLTDECDPDNLQPIDIPEIMEMAQRGEQDLIKIVKALVEGL